MAKTLFTRGIALLSKRIRAFSTLGVGRMWLIGKPNGEAHSHPGSHAGTLVNLSLKRLRGFNVANALALGGEPRLPDGFLEHQYWASDVAAYRIRVVDLPSGFASRHAGLYVRNQCLTMLDDPQVKIVLDWAEIAILSSSFADEVLAKLRLELGVAAFESRVRLENMTQDVRDAIARALANRPAP
jgi:hypothetical protein